MKKEETAKMLFPLLFIETYGLLICSSIRNLYLFSAGKLPSELC